jgi:ABC-type polysaccharide/polyol phosphate export permease
MALSPPQIGTEISGSGQEVRIEAVRSRLSLQMIATNAPVIKVLAMRDLKARYKQAVLGPIWIAFQPLALLAGFVVGFHSVGQIQTGNVPYWLFAIAGITIWAYFQATMIAGSASIISNSALVMKTACPRLAFPIASMIACLPSFLIPFVIGLIGAVATGLATARLLLLPLLAIWLFLVTAGIVGLSSSISVRFRDLLSVIPFLLQFGAFIVPVGYPVSALSPTLRVLVSLNPLTGIIEAWRWALLGSGVYVLSIYLALGVGLLLIITGWWVFGRLEVKMADVI